MQKLSTKEYWFQKKANKTKIFHAVDNERKKTKQKHKTGKPISKIFPRVIKSSK